MPGLQDARVGITYTDAEGRALHVLEVSLGAADGRQVVGILTREGVAPQPYATDAPTFRAVWIDRIPPIPPAVQEANGKR